MKILSLYKMTLLPGKLPSLWAGTDCQGSRDSTPSSSEQPHRTPTAQLTQGPTDAPSRKHVINTRSRCSKREDSHSPLYYLLETQPPTQHMVFTVWGRRRLLQNTWPEVGLWSQAVQGPRRASPLMICAASLGLDLLISTTEMRGSPPQEPTRWSEQILWTRQNGTWQVVRVS